jgi:hypothetical protein
MSQPRENLHFGRDVHGVPANAGSGPGAVALPAGGAGRSDAGRHNAKRAGARGLPEHDGPAVRSAPSDPRGPAA